LTGLNLACASRRMADRWERNRLKRITYGVD
jgi:hypothetical protein